MNAPHSGSAAGPSNQTPAPPQIAVIVDDSPSIVAQMLELLGTIDNCKAIGFTDPRQGLGFCLTNEIDLLVVDYEMPEINGINFVEAFRREVPNLAVPVVMVTSTKDRDVRYMALQLGATDFLNKPLDRMEFVARMRNLLAGAQAQKMLAELSKWLTDEVHKISMVVDQAPVAVVITDREGKIEYANPQYYASSGRTPEEILGRPAPLLTSEDADTEARKGIKEALASGSEWLGILRHCRGQQTSWGRVRLTPLRGEKGKIINFVFMHEDITVQKDYEARLDWQANYDALTRLPNRSLAQDRLRQAVAHAERGSDKVAVLFIDLDRFTQVNESLGHAAGDELLRLAAARLACNREDATLARMGNDEFVLILPDIGDSSAPEQEAERICGEIARPFLINGQEVFLSASIGVSLYPTDGTRSSDLLRHAQTAKGAAHAGGGNGWHFFTPELNAGARNRLKIEAGLRYAQANGELSLCYQPLIEIESGETLAAEALLRWNNPELGWVRPDHFIPIAEENGLILPIGAWVVEQVFQDLAGWREAGLPCPRIAINVSSRQFADRGLLDLIVAGLKKHKLDPSMIEIEVTERILLDQSPGTLSLLNEMRDMGLRFSIDDFGTGYSSMNYLTSFPFDVLKVDRSFVSKVTEREQDAALTQAIIAMAKSLGLEVVAEGVETQEQLDFLRRTGCTFAQGYLFSKPIPAAAFAERLAGKG